MLMLISTSATNFLAVELAEICFWIELHIMTIHNSELHSREINKIEVTFDGL